MFGIAFFASARYRKLQKHAHPPESAEAKPLPAPVRWNFSGNVTELLSRGDQALANQRFAEALNHYKEFLEIDPTGAGTIHYRVGLCNESLLKTDLAIAAYRRAIGGTPSATLSLAANLGIARCLLRMNEAAAMRQLLTPFLLDESRHEGLPTAFVAEARYLAALSLTRQTSYSYPPRVMDDDPVPASLTPLDLPLYLDEIAAGSKVAPEEVKETPEIPAPQFPRLDAPSRVNDSAKTFKGTRTGPAAEVLEFLAKEANSPLSWTPAAKATLADRSLHLVAKNAHSGELLETAADGLGLVCRVDGATTHIDRVADAKPAHVREFQHRLAARALRSAIIADPQHPLMPAACLELGNLDFANAAWTDAAAWYQRIVREAPASPIAPVAYTNLARMHLLKNENAEARRIFFHVIDRAPGHELALRAYLRIGQLHLERGAPDETLHLLQRAQKLAPESPAQPLIALALAAAHLHKGDFDQTRIALAKSSARLRNPPFRSDALLIDILAQLRQAKPEGNGRREASELLAALLSDSDESTLGPYGQWLMAAGYRELGLWDQSERILTLASKRVRGPFAPTLAFTLAETQVQRGNLEDAQKTFAKLADEPSPLQRAARLELAKIDFHGRRFPVTVERCRQLWQDRGDLEASPILHLWGSSLEAMGDLEKASQCFAGVAPD